MALQSSGAISLNQIHVEAGGSSGTACTINDSDIRGLISKGSGVSMNFAEWYGASSYTAPTINTHTFSSGTTTAGMSIGANGIVFEGATADAHETTLTAADPSQDNTITIPNETMTAITTATHATRGSHIVKCIALG